MAWEGLISLKQCGYKTYFWSNENDEPIHIHISKRNPTENSTKVWLTKSGGTIVANNKSDIPINDLKKILRVINDNYFEGQKLKLYC